MGCVIPPLAGRMVIAHHRPHSERFCDVTLAVKFYCDCDFAKSFRMGPHNNDLWLLFTCGVAPQVNG